MQYARELNQLLSRSSAENDPEYVFTITLIATSHINVNTDTWKNDQENDLQTKCW